MRKIKKIMMVAMSMILVAGMVMPLHAAGKVTVKAEWNCDTGLSVWTGERVKAYDYKRYRYSN